MRKRRPVLLASALLAATIASVLRRYRTTRCCRSRTPPLNLLGNNCTTVVIMRAGLVQMCAALRDASSRCSWGEFQFAATMAVIARRRLSATLGKRPRMKKIP
jgi:hypothetical protein